jgi:hypothetical protein
MQGPRGEILIQGRRMWRPWSGERRQTKSKSFRRKWLGPRYVVSGVRIKCVQDVFFRNRDAVGTLSGVVLVSFEYSRVELQ